MTWDEFKKLVDDELQKQGYDGTSVEIKVLDISYPDAESLGRNIKIEAEHDFVDLSIW